MPPTENAPKVTVLMCGGKKCCPEVREYADGSIDVVDEGQRVHLDPEQVKKLRELLNADGC